MIEENLLMPSVARNILGHEKCSLTAIHFGELALEGKRRIRRRQLLSGRSGRGKLLVRLPHGGADRGPVRPPLT